MHLTAGPEDRLYRFGDFTADPVVGRLYHAGEEVPLTPKAFKVLMVLVESGGQLVDKDQLFQQVWPDTFVEPNNLARHVSMIRRVLHDRAGNQEYIVTLSGRGYRFVSPTRKILRVSLDNTPGGRGTHDSVAGTAEPQAIQTPAAEPVRTAPAAHPRAPRRWPVLAGTVLATGLLSVMGSLAIANRDSADDTKSTRRLWQLTTTGRLNGEPSWSPDGLTIAYSSDREGSHNIWTQRLIGGSPVQLTTGSARDREPSWSPDGRQIAFRSERDGGGIFVVPVAGGGARRLAAFGYQPQWSPDGSRIFACAGRDVVILPLDGSAPVRRVTTAVLPDLPGPCRVAWHPDGRRISLLTALQDDLPAFVTIPLDGGPHLVSALTPTVKQRLSDAQLRLGRFVWSPGGDALFFEGRSERTQNVWRVAVNPRTLEWIDGPDRLTTSSGLDSALALSPDGRRLAFGSRFERTSVCEMPFDPIGGRITGEGHAITPDGANAKILDISPDASRLVYLVNARNTDELWIQSLDRRIEKLRKVEVDAAIVHPRWSKDGRQLAYVRRPTTRTQAASVMLISADTDKERQLLAGSQPPEMVYDWALDGDSLLVRCRTKGGRAGICRLSASSPSAADMQTIAADEARNLYAAAYSPNGRWVSFIAAPDLTRSAVFVSPSTGGAWMPITDSDDRWFRDLPRWSPDGRTLYFLSNHTGFWNLWGRRFDSDNGVPRGEPFQISHFDSSFQMIGPDVSSLQVALTDRSLILPLTQASGAVWILENVDH